MKVLSFIELWTNDSKFIIEYCRMLESDSGEFYSQPFKHELITELFEGWIADADEPSYTYATFTNPNTIIDFGEYRNASLYTINYVRFYVPRTLDDFINDCQRVGVGLEWRVK
jgi:hypothetical protein